MRCYGCFLVLILFFIGCTGEEKDTPNQAQRHDLEKITSDKKMVRIPAGKYQSFIGKDSGRIVKLAEFHLDDSPVTNAEYLAFVKANPQWRKSQVLRIFADSTYLKTWPSDEALPKDRSPLAPVTNVSWYAAKAYAESVGKRLPTVDEWEYVARADQQSADASDKTQFTNLILKSYQTKDKHKSAVKQGDPNYYGVYDMYKVWEWSEDFNSVMISGESRRDGSGDESLFCAGASVTSADLRNYAAFMRYALRGSLKANYCLNNLGFRCAKDVSP